jgi:3-methyl-2-oxobutanoate hydroxymethyltransferase
MEQQKITVLHLRKMKEERKPIVMVTAYDYPSASVAEQAGVDVVLVGDSLGMVVLGYETTIPVTMEDMIHHTKAVKRGLKHPLTVTDMPFLSYHTSVGEALRNAGRLVQEGGCDAVKLEGGEEILPQVEAIVKAGIPVVGHIGLTPQSVHQLGGYRVQGKDYESARKIVRDAFRLQEAGCAMIVLECVPSALAALISAKLDIPTIGIGAGAECDGQVLVYHDLLGIQEGTYLPKFVKPFARLFPLMVEGVRQYAAEVRDRQFPDESREYHIDDAVLDKLRKEMAL